MILQLIPKEYIFGLLIVVMIELCAVYMTKVRFYWCSCI